MHGALDSSRMQQRYQRSPGNTVSGPASLAGGGSMAHSLLPCAPARQTRYVAQPSAVLQHGEWEQSPPALTTQPAGAGAGGGAAHRKHALAGMAAPQADPGAGGTPEGQLTCAAQAVPLQHAGAVWFDAPHSARTCVHEGAEPASTSGKSNTAAAANDDRILKGFGKKSSIPL